MTVVSVTPANPSGVSVSTAGPRGKGWHFGLGAPTDEIGFDSEMYLDTETFNAYGPKVGGTWVGTPIVNLAGQADLAQAAQEAAEAARDAGQEWATKAEDAPISVEAGGNGTTDFSALHHARKAAGSVDDAAVEVAAAETARDISVAAAGISTTKADEAASSALALDAAVAAYTIDPADLLPTPPPIDLRMTSVDAIRSDMFSRPTGGGFADGLGIYRVAGSNILRIDHDPVTGVNRGALLEGAATNLLLYSEQFDNAAWTKTFGAGSTVAANGAVAPDGTATMDKIIASTSNGQHRVDQEKVVASGSAVTVSVFASAAEFSKFTLLEPKSVKGVLVDLTTGTVGPVTDIGGVGAPAASGIASVGNGIYLVWITTTVPSTAAGLTVLLHNGSASSFTGDGTSGLYIWGAQLEAGPVPTSYVKTTTAAASRAADLLQITGTDFTDIWNPREGTIFLDFTIPDGLAASPNGQMLFEANDGSYGERIYIYRAYSGSVSVNAYSASAASTTFALGTIASMPAGSRHRIAFAFKADDFAVSLNGAAPLTDNSGAMPSGLTNLSIGSRGSGLQWNGHIKRMVYSQRRASNATLKAMTS